MTYTYEIMPGGYRILLDGELQIEQPFYPDGDPAMPIADADRDTYAQAQVDALVLANTPPPEPPPAP